MKATQLRIMVCKRGTHFYLQGSKGCFECNRELQVGRDATPAKRLYDYRNRFHREDMRRKRKTKAQRDPWAEPRTTNLVGGVVSAEAN